MLNPFLSLFHGGEAYSVQLIFKRKVFCVFDLLCYCQIKKGRQKAEDPERRESLGEEVI